MLSINTIKKTVRVPALLIAVVSLTGCAVLDENINVQASDVHTTPLTCSNQLVGSHESVDGALDSADIRLVNWNIQKGGDPEWSTDLATFEGAPNLTVLQEVPLDSDAWSMSEHRKTRSAI